VVDPFDTTVSAGVVSTRGDFAYTQEFVDCGQKLGADLRVIIRKKGRWTTPEKEEAAVNSALETGNMSARRLKRSVNRKMYQV